MFSICTAYIENGKLEETLMAYTKSEENFTRDIGVFFRKFFQCEIQPHIIWSITEWESEKHHHDAAQSIMKIRRDDRFASIGFGPEPYFEIFSSEDSGLKIGLYSESYEYIIIIRGLISDKVKEKYIKLRKERIEEQKDKIQWLSVFHNNYNTNEFITFLGFVNESYFSKIRQINDLYLEEYLFTGLRNPLGMSYLANYNQFICRPVKF